MKRIKITLALLIGVTNFQLAQILAQEAARSITLSQARELALENNKEIKKSQFTIERTHNDQRAYKTKFFPRLNAFALDAYSSVNGDISIAGGHLPIYSLDPTTGAYIPGVIPNADGSYTLKQYADFPSQKLDYKVGNVFLGGVSLTQPLYMGGKIRAAYKMSSRGVDMANENLRLTESQVILKTDEAYVQAVRARQLADVARAYKQVLDELLKNVQSAVRHGMKHHNDELKVQVKLNEAELSIERADNATRLTTMNLCHILGLPLNTPLQIQTDLFPDDTAPGSNAYSESSPASAIGGFSAESSSLANRPETAILQAKSDIAAEQVRLTRSDYMPQLALFAGYTYMNGIKLAGEKLFNNGSGAVGVTLKVPIITFGERTYKERSAKAEQQIALMDQQDLTEQMQLELAQAFNNYSEAQTEFNLTCRSLEQAEENMRLVRQQYDHGMEPLSQLLEAQALWQQASADKVEAQCQRQMAHTKLLKAQGNLK